MADNSTKVLFKTLSAIDDETTVDSYSFYSAQAAVWIPKILPL